MSTLQSAAVPRLAVPCLKYSISLLAASLVVSGCTRGERQAASADAPAAETGVAEGASAATIVSTIQVRARPQLRENSAAVMSASQPGILFTINDSGNEPVLFALDTAGTDRGAWVIRGAQNRDWEAAALGPCRAPSGREHDRADSGAREVSPEAATSCVYIGDVGDNAASRRTLTIYRVAEPRALASGVTDTLIPERLTFRYADGPHDVEALWVSRTGTTWLITKRRLAPAGGSARPALIFALPASAWQHSDSVATAPLVDSIPVVPGSATGRLITDAALSPDGMRLAFRTYREVFVFDADPATGRVAGNAPRLVCDIRGLRERQGEGIAWLGDSERLLLTSEGNRSPMHVIRCAARRGPG